MEDLGVQTPICTSILGVISVECFRNRFQLKRFEQKTDVGQVLMMTIAKKPCRLRRVWFTCVGRGFIFHFCFGAGPVVAGSRFKRVLTWRWSGLKERVGFVLQKLKHWKDPGLQKVKERKDWWKSMGSR